MAKTSHKRNVAAGLAHVEGFIKGTEVTGQNFLREHCIVTGQGDPHDCALGLRSHSLGKALLGWFSHRNLAQFKQHIFEVAKFECIGFGLRPNRFVDEMIYFAPLLADNAQLLNWFRIRDLMPMMEQDNPTTHSFRWFQMMYALRADWETLARRAQQVIALVPRMQKQYMVDEHFYLALAQGDVAGMEAALTELTNEKLARMRNHQFDFSYTRFFVGTHAVMYAKLAWLHGYQVKVDTPYIPAEWLPIEPLAQYDEPYAFMREFDMDKPLNRSVSA